MDKKWKFNHVVCIILTLSVHLYQKKVAEWNWRAAKTRENPAHTCSPLPVNNMLKRIWLKAFAHPSFNIVQHSSREFKKVKQMLKVFAPDCTHQNFNLMVSYRWHGNHRFFGWRMNGKFNLFVSNINRFLARCIAICIR